MRMSKRFAIVVGGLAFVGMASTALIGWLQELGPIEDKTFAAIIAGGILAALGGFVGVFVSEI
jgi:hypothetical protein